MFGEVQSLVNTYIHWLKDKTQLKQLDDWIEITTPYLDRHNDYLQIYARRHDDGYVLTDAGYIIQDLELSGCPLDTPKRKQLLQMTLNGFGVKLVDSALEVRASESSFALNKHNLIQAMLSVNDLFNLVSPNISSLFFEDVMAWLDANDIRYTRDVIFKGESGLDHQFEFTIPRSRAYPERLIKTVNIPDQLRAKSIVFSWIDIRDVRPEQSKAYVILNDKETTVSDRVVSILTAYDINPIPWSNREATVAELVG